MNLDREDVLALIFDIDGTIVDDNKRISANLCALLGELVSERHLRVILASSRSDRSLREVASALGLICGLVCYDGGLVIDEEHRKLSESFLDLPLGDGGIFDTARESGLTHSLFDPEGWFTSDLGYWTQREITGTGVTPILLTHEQLTERLAVRADGIYKLMFRGEEDRIRAFSGLAIAQALAERNTCYSSRPTIYEAVSRHVDKFQSCGLLLDKWDVLPGNVVFFGDGVNDVSCLSGFQHSVAMANASDSVKSYARYVAGSNNEDGVFFFLNKLFAT